MKAIRVAKVTLNIATGADPGKNDRALELSKRLTGKTPVKTLSGRKARTFRVRRGLPIGVKVTLRGDEAVAFLKKVLVAKENTLKPGNFDGEGNFGFGLTEYLDIPGMKYDPVIGMIGLNVGVTLERPGFRIKRRKIKKSKIGHDHRITKDAAIEFAQKTLGVKVEEE